jgi:hypothetical protein
LGLVTSNAAAKKEGCVTDVGEGFKPIVDIVHDYKSTRSSIATMLVVEGDREVERDI